MVETTIVSRDSVRRDMFAFLAFAALVFAAWKMSNNFFWRDEWLFLENFSKQGAGYLLESYNGHVKPIFKFFYFLELKIFGINSVLFHYTNLLIHAIGVFIFFKIVSLFKIRFSSAFLIASIFAIHPLLYNHLLWSFQICVTLHLTFMLAMIYWFVRYTLSGGSKELYFVAAFMVLQNYCFGNGLFSPLLFIGYALFFWSKKESIKLIVIGGTMLGVFLAVQILFSNRKVESIGFNPTDIVTAVFYFIRVNITRFFFIKEAYFGVMLQLFFLILVVATSVWIYIKSSTISRKHLFLFAALFFLASVSIPLARPGIVTLVMPHYYTVLSFVPYSLFFVLALLIVKEKYFQSKWKPAYAYSVILVGVVYFVLDQSIALKFSYRNFKNSIALETSLKNNSAYIPFDDPAYSMIDIYRDIDYLSVYQYWNERTKVNFEGKYSLP